MSFRILHMVIEYWFKYGDISLWFKNVWRTRYSYILVYPTYYHVTNLVGLTNSDCTSCNLKWRRVFDILDINFCISCHHRNMRITSMVLLMPQCPICVKYSNIYRIKIIYFSYLLEDILYQKSSHNTHCCRQTSSAHTFTF